MLTKSNEKQRTLKIRQRPKTYANNTLEKSENGSTNSSPLARTKTKVHYNVIAKSKTQLGLDCKEIMSSYYQLPEAYASSIVLQFPKS